MNDQPSSSQTVAAPRDGGSLEQLLLEKMDAAVLSFAEIMADNSLIQTEDQRYVPRNTTAERIKAFELVNEYVAKRHKLLQPGQPEESAFNVEALKALMREESLRTLERENVVRIKPRGKKGRPPNTHVAAERLQATMDAGHTAEDDTELQALLGAKS